VDSGYYAACTGLRTQTQALELVANNLANIHTGGYRGQQASFRALLSAARAIDPLSQAVNDFNVLSGSALDLSPGSMEATAGPLDLAIEGNGFFAVQTAGGILYTRNGNFQASAKGELITSQGDEVLGEQGPIRLPGGKVSVSPDGTLSSGGAVFGKLRLVDFPPGSSLEPAGGSYYAASQASPHPATAMSVRQGMLEASNVDPVHAVVSLISVQRHAEMLERALSIFHSEFNRIAAGDLPRV
jgi:flagellar basal-body rod protein FlgF